jgi:hypothetical protein
VPEGAILAGHDKDGGSLYIGRAYYESDILPAKIVPNNGAAYVAHGGQEHQVSHYEVQICTALHSNAPLFRIRISTRRLAILLDLLSEHLQMSELVIKNRLRSATSISFHYVLHSYSSIWNNMTYFGVKASLNITMKKGTPISKCRPYSQKSLTCSYKELSHLKSFFQKVKDNYSDNQDFLQLFNFQHCLLISFSSSLIIYKTLATF